MYVASTWNTVSTGQEAGPVGQSSGSSTQVIFGCGQIFVQDLRQDIPKHNSCMRVQETPSSPGSFAVLSSSCQTLPFTRGWPGDVQMSHCHICAMQAALHALISPLIELPGLGKKLRRPHETVTSARQANQKLLDYWNRVVKAVTLNMSCAQVKPHRVRTAIGETLLRTKSAGHELWAAKQPGG